MSVSIGTPVRADRSASSPDSRGGAVTIAVIAACVHLLAAAVTYRDVVTDLYALFAQAPQLSVMARGLTRLLAVSIFLPPILPALLLGAAALWLRDGIRHFEVARSLALGCAALAADSALRALGVLVAPAPANLGEVLDLQNRLAPGARTVAALVGAQPGPGVEYWLAIFTLGALGAIWFVARAVQAAELASLEPRTGRRRRRGAGGVAAFQALVVALGAYLALGALGKAALPVATQLFLKLFG